MSLYDNTIIFTGGELKPIQSSARFIRIREATSSVFIVINGGSEIERQKGEQIDLGENYAELRLHIRSVVAQTVVITTAAQRQDDNRNTVTVTATATVESGNDNQHLPKVTVGAGLSVKIADSNIDRKSLRVSLLSSAPGYVLLGKGGIVTDQGGAIEEGMVDYIDTTGELWVFNPQAVAVDVYVMEINKL